MTEATNGSTTVDVPEAHSVQAARGGQADEELVAATVQKTIKAMQGSGGSGEAPPWRMVLPALIGVALLGILAFVSILSIVVILPVQAPPRGAAVDTYSTQIATALALLGSLASAAVRGIAGMLTLALGQRRSEQGGSK